MQHIFAEDNPMVLWISVTLKFEVDKVLENPSPVSDSADADGRVFVTLSDAKSYLLVDCFFV